MKGAWKLTVPLFILSVAGAYISILLLNKHLLKTNVPTWFATVCGDEVGNGNANAPSTQPAGADAGPEQEQPWEEEPPIRREAGGADCDSVLASRWGTIPPRPKDEEDTLPTGVSAQKGEISIPTAYLGFVYFIGFAIWFLFIGRPTPDRPEWYRIPLAFNIGGVGSAVFFTFIMLTQTEEWCPWCMVTHVINVVMLGGMIKLRPKKVEMPSTAPSSWAERTAAKVVATAVTPESATPENAGAEADVSGELTAEPPLEPMGEFVLEEVSGETVGAPVRSHPSLRLVALCILLSAATSAMVWNGYHVMVERTSKKLVEKELEAFKGDVHLLSAIYESSPKVKIPIRPDDPQIAKEGEIHCSLVVFSDFQCPFCRTFALLVDKKIQPLFSGCLRVTWKHFPLSTECNKRIRSSSHPEACQAARAAEAARIQGGNDAFWKAHDLLFVAHRKLKGFDYRALAGELGLDPDAFLADMYSPEVTTRIAEDIALARSFGVRSTPTVFLSGRRVDSKLVRLLPFWEVMAHKFSFLRDKKIEDRMRREQRARKTRAAASQPTTRGTPGPADGP